MSTNDNTTTSTCAACGKEGDNLKSCVACKLVKYCNRDCQVSHRRAHKKECKKRAAELYDEQLFKEPSPPEQCPICKLILPIDTEQSTFKSCCSRVICNGCCDLVKEEHDDHCPFCKVKIRSHEEEIKRLKELMDEGNADACLLLGSYYETGDMGLPQDHDKTLELWQKAGELGCAEAYYNLGNSFFLGYGVEVDKKKTKHYYELAAMNGNIKARSNLGSLEAQARNLKRSYKHITIAAKAGDTESLKMIKQGFMFGVDITEEHYARTLQAYQTRQSEMKSDARDNAARARGQNNIPVEQDSVEESFNQAESITSTFRRLWEAN